MGLSKMERILRHDQAVAKKYKSSSRKQGLVSKIHVDALMSAVRHEGKYIMTTEGLPYWKDMHRRYPHLNLLGSQIDTGESVNGSRNHFGKVNMRFTASRGWEKNVGGRFIPCDREGNLKLEVAL